MNKEIDQRYAARAILLTAFSGFSAFVIITMGALGSAWFYSGRTHESYSFFNHFISELGNRNYSSHAYFFNGGMMLGGFPMLLFMYGIYSLLASRVRYPFLVVGLCSGVLCILLGYYSSERYDIHIEVALAQFNAMLLSSVFFSIAVIYERGQSYFHRWLAYAGAFPILCIIAFLAVEYQRRDAVRAGHTHFLLNHRPAFWAVPFMEWMVFFSLIVWVAVICVYLLYLSTRERAVR